MPNLKANEYMHTCESDICAQTTGGSRRGKPRPYIVRSYYNDIEKKWCQTCCKIKSIRGITKDVYKDGQWAGYKLA